MNKRLDWDKAKSDKLKGRSSNIADVDMISETEHQEWWGGKTGEQRAVSKEVLEKQMADVFSRDTPTTVKGKPRDVADAFVSPKIKALLKQTEARSLRREQISKELFSRPKTKAKRPKSKR